jgi:hypothetical protein
MKKIESTELETLRALNSKVHDMKYDIADIEVSLQRLTRKKTSVLFDIENAANELQEFQATLFEKYGNAKIDLKTGEYSAE